jgi:hypothetical protein
MIIIKNIYKVPFAIDIDPKITKKAKQIISLTP